MAVATTVIGIDINRDAIRELSARGVPNLIVGDIQELGRLGIEMSIDVVVAGEVLEHLSNPGQCINGICGLLRESEGEAIVTVPNAFSVRGFMTILLRQREIVRHDHHFYFSYVTLNSLLRHHGLTPVEWFTYSNLRDGLKLPKRLAKKLLNQTIFRISPFVAEGLIAVARPASGQTDTDGVLRWT